MSRGVCLITALFAAVSLAEEYPASLLRATSAARAETGETVITGNDGWLLLPAELRHVGAGRFWGESAAAVSRATRPESADPLPAILDFHEQLSRLGIELILLPVPAKVMVYPEALLDDAPDVGRLDPFHEEFIALLREKGLKVIDLLPELLEARAKTDAPEPLFCREDTHWSGVATIIAARRIAAFLEGRDWLQALPRIDFAYRELDISFTGDLRRMMDPQAPHSETLRLRVIDAAQTPTVDRNSPLLLLGDSHNLVFHGGGDMLAANAGLPDQIAIELGIAVDLVAVRGSGATPARVNLMRRSRADPDYLSGKHAVVWCFTVREFTESTGWTKVPILTFSQ